MSRLGPRARKIISRQIDDRVEAFDNSIVIDHVLLADDDAPEELYHIATAAEAAYHGMSCTRDTDADATPVHDSISNAHFSAVEALSELIDQLVAEQCAYVLEHADEWADRDADPDADILNRRDRSEYEAAKAEARNWLDEHEEVVRRSDAYNAPESSA